MHLGRFAAVRVSLALAIVLGLGLLAPPAATAQEPTPTTLTLVGEPAYAGEDSPLAIHLADQEGAPVMGAPVLVERRLRGEWTEVAVLVTDDAGDATTVVRLTRDASDNVFRASYDGDELHAPSTTGLVGVPLLRRNTRLTLGGPTSVVDEQSVTLRVRWRAGNGEPVPGTVRVYRREGEQGWRIVERVQTGADGRAELEVQPRRDTRWRAEARRLDWVEGDRSGVHRIDNLPPGVPVSLPSGAPRPRISLPAQSSATGEGPRPVIRRIPDRMWAGMRGRSYHAGCPVGRSSLRLLQINYWDFAGYRRRGELVAHADAIGQMAGALVDMYHAKLPIRAMYRVDHFGWSRRLRGADDYASMAAGNTSAFNCRDVVGRPGVRSPHSYGRSLDINPWENPFRSSHGPVPNTWWLSRSHPRVAWRSREHRVVRTMAAHGLRWTYGTNDSHHFDAGSAAHRRQGPQPAECGGVCE